MTYCFPNTGQHYPETALKIGVSNLSYLIGPDKGHWASMWADRIGTNPLCIQDLSALLWDLCYMRHGCWLCMQHRRLVQGMHYMRCLSRPSLHTDSKATQDQAAREQSAGPVQQGTPDPMLHAVPGPGSMLYWERAPEPAHAACAACSTGGRDRVLHMVPCQTDSACSLRYSPIRTGPGVSMQSWSSAASHIAHTPDWPPVPQAVCMGLGLAHAPHSAWVRSKDTPARTVGRAFGTPTSRQRLLQKMIIAAPAWNTIS